MQPSQKIQAEAAQTKSWFPFRKVCIVVEPNGTEYVIAKETLHMANAAARKGASVYLV